MLTKQVSVFVENKKGRMEQVSKCLSDGNINIVSMILADTSEYGLLRMIVSDAPKAKEVLEAAGFSAIITKVLVVKFPNIAGTLDKLMGLFNELDLSIEYMYGISTSADSATLVVKTSDNDAAAKVISEKGAESDISVICM